MRQNEENTKKIYWKVGTRGREMDNYITGTRGYKISKWMHGFCILVLFHWFQEISLISWDFTDFRGFHQQNTQLAGYIY